MTTEAAQTPEFGIRQAGVIFLQFMFLHWCSTVLLALLVGKFGESINDSFFQKQPISLDLMFTAVERLLSPWMLLLFTLLGLNQYFRLENVSSLLKRFGFGRRSRFRVLIGSFIGGFVLLEFFVQLLVPAFTDIGKFVTNPLDRLNQLPGFLRLALNFTSISITPIAEEFMFRGVLYAGFQQAWNKVGAVIATSAIFVLLHGALLGSGNWLTHLMLVIVAISLGVTRAITNSLMAPVMLHAGINFAGNNAFEME